MQPYRGAWVKRITSFLKTGHARRRVLLENALKASRPSMTPNDSPCSYACSYHKSAPYFYCSQIILTEFSDPHWVQMPTNHGTRKEGTVISTGIDIINRYQVVSGSRQLTLSKDLTLTLSTTERKKTTTATSTLSARPDTEAPIAE